MLISADVTDTLLPHMLLRWSVFILRNALNDPRSAEHDAAGITTIIFTTLQKSDNISNISFSCFVCSISETVVSGTSAHDENSRIFSARLPESHRRFRKI